MNSIPILRLELTDAKQRLLMAIMERNESYQELVDSAIDRAIIELPATVAQEASTVLHETIKNEIVSYFKFGEGRDFIQDVTKKAMRGALLNLKKSIKEM